MPGTSERSSAQSNSAAGCRLLALGSLASAAEQLVPNQRLRLEHSAAAWTARAEMMDLIDRKRALRCAAATA